MNDNTRFRNQDDPARLNLELTNRTHPISELKYGCSPGLSDHVIIEMDAEAEGRAEDDVHKIKG